MSTINPKKVNVYFTDYFKVDPKNLESYGALNISLINDLPLFIDPFLLFTSEKSKYKELHKSIIEYVKFLRDLSIEDGISESLLTSLFRFPEVKQNWLGYSKLGNGGSGLGKKFANSLYQNLNSVFNNFGSEKITKGSHLEKLSLIDKGVGKDNISDFTTNLIKKFLLEYTQEFAQNHIENSMLKSFPVRHVEFNYKTRTWMHGNYILPNLNEDYVLLTPKDMLTRDEPWISHKDFINEFENVVDSIPNKQLRGHINEYLLRNLSEDSTKQEIKNAIFSAIEKHSEIIDYYIRYKEDRGKEAENSSRKKISETESTFIEHVSHLIYILIDKSGFYKTGWDTLDEAYQRVLFLKQVIENNDGYRLFYIKGKPIKREADLQVIYRLTWFGSISDVNSEVNNGRGPVDYKISRGSKDSTLIEFKLASNSKLKRNLEKQVEIYQNANQTHNSIKVILFFSIIELNKINRILRELEIKPSKNLVLIDARTDNKPSASIA